MYNIFVNILFLIIGIVVVIIPFLIIKLCRLFKLKIRWEKAKKGEFKAINTLKKMGFQIIKEQFTTKISIYINDKKEEVTIRPDFLVKKNERLGIVDVKTGEIATNPLYSATRRQLLEYSTIPEIKDIYLLDMNINKLIKISFDLPESLLKTNKIKKSTEKRFLLFNIFITLLAFLGGIGFTILFIVD